MKRKDRRQAKTGMQVHLPDGTAESRDFDPEEVLGPIAIPSYYEAGALTNKPIADGLVPCDYHFIIVAPASKRGLEQGADVSVDLSADSVVFAQMLAKIALGFAVARLGVRGFQRERRHREFLEEGRRLMEKKLAAAPPPPVPVVAPPAAATIQPRPADTPAVTNAPDQRPPAQPQPSIFLPAPPTVSRRSRRPRRR